MCLVKYSIAWQNRRLILLISEMASPRLTISAISQRNLSPHTFKNLSSLRNSSSPQSSSRVVSPREYQQRTPCKHRVIPFNIDTPNRVKIINDTLPNEERSLLGCGGFGKVYEASFRGERVAVKIVKRQRRSDVSVEAEKHASTLIHENIVKIFRIEQGSVSSLITMELCNMSLEEKLEQKSLCGAERLGIWRALASALEFCHRCGIIHADVKPKNVLIASDGKPKLTDFGSSVLIGAYNENLLSLHGTPGYVAPEVIRGNKPNMKSDIYSLGVLAWQLLSRKAPFTGCHPHTILYLTGKGMRPADEDFDDEFEGKYKILYRKLWSHDTICRPPLNFLINKLSFKEFQIST